MTTFWAILNENASTPPSTASLPIETSDHRLSAQSQGPHSLEKMSLDFVAPGSRPAPYRVGSQTSHHSNNCDPKIKAMRENIAALRVQAPVDLDKITSGIEDLDDSSEGAFEPDNVPRMRFIDGLLHLGDGPQDDLLEKLRILENSETSIHKIQEEMALLQYGRSRSLLGVFYSFLSLFDDAEKAFQESDRYMEYEACVEIKLHRMLWYAEHKTRIQDWGGVGMLICKAHEVFMNNDAHSEFIVTHFPDRFRFLVIAASRQVPIDEVVKTMPPNISEAEFVLRLFTEILRIELTHYRRAQIHLQEGYSH
ncbi:hypothetical protein B0J12DRAFT_736722 [Macrophomina phaseolina]|uniref:Uncharacterized protein n=1 Tax=Macrophomina phaseolina TaxID=35725 RepID=A0ABQ8GL34_9PEZI|nr:hypothetical protein B0J12DRAFT_736722 [Macrophomina phaseolina]